MKKIGSISVLMNTTQAFVKKGDFLSLDCLNNDKKPHTHSSNASKFIREVLMTSFLSLVDFYSTKIYCIACPQTFPAVLPICLFLTYILTARKQTRPQHRFYQLEKSWTGRTRTKNYLHFTPRRIWQQMKFMILDGSTWTCFIHKWGCDILVKLRHILDWGLV